MTQLNIWTDDAFLAQYKASLLLLIQHNCNNHSEKVKNQPKP